MKRIVIIAPAFLPIPATKGGAIETLIQHLIKENEKQKKVHLTIISHYEEKACFLSKEFSNTNFIWYKTTGLVEKVRNRINRHLLCPLKREPFYSNWQAFIIKSLQKLDFDKVIVENNVEFLPILRRHIGSKDIICHLHNRFDLEEDSLDVCNGVFTVSEYVKQEVIRQTHYSSDKIKVILNCIDKESFHPSVNNRNIVRKKLNLSEKDVAICFVGRIVELKGVRHLVEAFKRLNAENARLFIVGSLGGNFGEADRQHSPFVQELFELVEPIKEKVVFTGFIANEKVHELLDGMDIALNPSLYKEAALVSNVEYEAMRLPIVTTNRGGIPEYVSEDCAYILDADNNLENQIFNALERLINDKELRDRMGKSGLENAKKYYRDQYYNRFIDIVN